MLIFFSLDNILLSIVTPVKDIFNWENNIIRNVTFFKKSNINYEFLFVYSSPIDKSVLHLQKIFKEENNIVFCLAQGNGIYSAMNKGIESSKGEFLIFIGADDTFNQSEIANFVETLNNNNAQLILFEVLFKGESKKNNFLNKEGGITSLIHWTLGQPRVHQAIVYKRSFIIEKKIRYLTRLKVTSDYIFTSEVCSYNPLIYKKNLPIIFYDRSGFSSEFSYTYRYLEHIKGFFLINRLRKYLVILIISRILLIFYKSINISSKKIKSLFKCFS